MQQFGNPFYNYNPYQAQYNPMNPYQERLAQLQAQSAQPQAYPQQSTGLNGEIVDGIDVVRAKNVDMSGNVTFYPKADLSEIFTKQLMPDGTSKIVTYRAMQSDQNEQQGVPQQTQQQTVNLESLNAMLGQLKMDILQGIGGELENIKQMIPSTPSNPEPPDKRGGTSK